MKMTCICILNYNNGRKTIRCISSILDQTMDSYRMIIIDNDSNDDSLLLIREFLQERHLTFRLYGNDDHFSENPMAAGEIVLVRSDRNAGYSSGNNIAMRMAKSVNIFSYLLILNNDVVLKESFLEEMVKRNEYLRELNNSTQVALGATELGPEGEFHHSGFQYIHLLTGITFASPCFPSYKYIPGSCIFMDIDAPLMDESFFLYFDDTQYSKILRRNGYILENSPHSVYFHEVGGTVKKNLQWLILAGLFRFYLLNYPLLLPVVIPLRLLLILYLFVKNIFISPEQNG